MVCVLGIDLLVPVALEGVIGPWNVDRIRAPIIAEVANGPIIGEVDVRLCERVILVLLDLLVNTGGVATSYFEWVQNQQGFPWTLDEVRTRLHAILSSAFQEVWDLAAGESIFLQSVAYTLALRRIASAIEGHGTRAYFSTEQE